MIGLVPNEVPFVAMAWSLLLVVGFGAAGVFENSSLGAAGAVLLGAGGDRPASSSYAGSASAGPAVHEALDAADRSRRSVPRSRSVPCCSSRSSPVAAMLCASPIRLRRARIRNQLDVYLHRARPEGRPVLVYLHGGAWTHGKKDQQGLPIVYHFASRGWLCVHPTTASAPTRRSPIRLIDMKRAIAWVHAHAHEHGGDPRQVFIAGGSAGGHLSALAALTMNDPALQPGFEDADTSIVAAIPLYGDYDWLDTSRRACHARPRPVEVLHRHDREVLARHRPCDLGAGFPALPRAARCTTVLRRARCETRCSWSRTPVTSSTRCGRCPVAGRVRRAPG